MLGAVLWKYLVTGVIAGFGALLLQYLWDLLKRNLRRDLPPGPYGLPLVGYLPFMPKEGHRGVEELKNKYGPVFGVHLGSRYVVFLCDFESTKEALSQDCLLDRPEEFPFMVHEKSQGLMVLNGPLWKEQRRFSLRLFKNLGIATQAMENHIHVSAINFFPWLRKLLVFFRFGTCEQLRDALERREDFADSKINSHQSTYQDGLVRDYIDGFLSEMKQQGEGNRTFTRNLLKGNVASFFGAGSETSRSAIEWLLLHSATHPEMQRRIHSEIDDVLGSGRGSAVSWGDRNRMPFTQAFMWEVMRCKPVNPLSVMRQ
ncbi:hypothetical protein HPB48_010584 [Haemaphysalis longicornis]|uniref:Cytochrome P450 n=1 Tax=Haemaphysalis longicornis TaxID=44386 RepID=A0A9J6H2A9_HAELO|nr:hypothetical protein HPB48_010584 [Haemaphysalis longicornis]